LVTWSLGQAQVPRGVLVPGMRPEESVLVDGTRLALAPVAAEHVPPGLDELASVLDRGLVHGIGGHRPSLDPAGRRPIKALRDGLAGGSRTRARDQSL